MSKQPAKTPFAAETMDRRHLDNIKSRRLRNISSLAFGGSDLKTIYMGYLLGDSLATFPFAGGPKPRLTGFLMDNASF